MSSIVFVTLLTHLVPTLSQHFDLSQINSVGRWTVPTFTLKELTNGQRLAEFASVMSTTGLLAVKPIHDPAAMSFDDARSLALSGLCDCTSQAPDSFQMIDGTDTVRMQDGQTTRTSFATATLGNTPLPLPERLGEVCGSTTAEAMDNLRDHVESASNAFVTALDQLLLSRRTSSFLLQNEKGWNYPTVASITQASSNLEHFHVYSKNANEKTEDSSQENYPTLDWHTDAGLFLSFVDAHGCGDSSDNSFFIQDEAGIPYRAVIPEGTIGLMLGIGAEEWLHASGLRATRHALQLQNGIARAWYGTMNLVPEGAIVQTAPRQTFGDMRRAMVLSSSRANSFGNSNEGEIGRDVAVGCGNVYDHSKSNSPDVLPSRRRLQTVSSANQCDNHTHFYCWMNCLEIPDAGHIEDFVNDGFSLYCLDPAALVSSGNKVSDAVKPCTEDGIPGQAMNPSCMGSWQPTAPGVPAQEINVNGTDIEELFCYGGTSMYMDGFTWVGTTCIVYLFSSWVLDTEFRLFLASVGTLLFGIAIEWVIHQRRRTMESYPAGKFRLGLSATFYGLQLSMGYTLMLIVMIYSLPLFLSVIVGIVIGHVLFNAQDAIFEGSKICDNHDISSPEGDDQLHGHYQPIPPSEAPLLSETRNRSAVPEGITPCCQHTL